MRYTPSSWIAPEVQVINTRRFAGKILKIM